MLIDAAHPEEVRVCVLENGKVEDFDFELSSRKPLRGNIYLARVTRVEPSLQAAFVEYGGNRHGFLAFNEIHPDYYQIPVSDRRLLQEAEAEEAALAAELELEQRGDDRAAADDDDFEMVGGAGGDADIDEYNFEDADSDADHESTESAEDEFGEDDGAPEHEEDGEESDSGEEVGQAALKAGPLAEISESAETDSDDAPQDLEAPDADGEPGSAGESEGSAGIDSESQEARAEDEPDAERPARRSRRGKRGGEHRNELLERYKEARRKRARLLRNYRIQEVIKRRQILLVQVVKEERGNKGAALTTYLSLAGRYCVLMPNTARGGGISRKIPGPADRKRLRHVVGGLEVPQGMGLIIRTAGAKRTKAEIKRDYDYLIRLWENIRSLTLSSIAPCLIYEEASLIKRAIRDLYDKDIATVLVEGESGYREAKDFMKMLMPSHAKNVQPYKEKTPLFLRYNVESQLDAMYHPTVRLKSGGYLVIHQTEALVAIDVNSGKSTRERNIELTALKTNIEAAREAARQCRLRDLAGLVVIDFIDMMENRNNRSVEKALKDALKNDRARIQVGRISNFGLMEMSRQRRRSSIVEGTTHACPTCGGAGVIRSNEMAALRILRAIEGDALSGRTAVISAKVSLDVALYMLNHKRAWLKRIEDDYALSIEIVADSGKAGDQFEIEKHGAARELPEVSTAIRPDQPDVAPEVEESGEEAGPPVKTEAGEIEGAGKKRRRRRRRRREESVGGEISTARPEEPGADEEEAAEESVSETAASGAETEEDQSQKKRRRRGRRGGRRNRRRSEDETDASDETAPAIDALSADAEPASSESPPLFAGETAGDAPAASLGEDSGGAESDEPAVSPSPEEPVNGHQIDAPEDVREAQIEPPAAPREPEPVAISEAPGEPKSSRKGWWQKALGG
jgi:ribonuclease E